MRAATIAIPILLLIAPLAHAAAPAPAPGVDTDATGKLLTSPPAPVATTPAPTIAWKLPAPSGPPHPARPYRGPKPKQDGLQLQAKPHVWPVRGAQFLGWALVP